MIQEQENASFITCDKWNRDLRVNFELVAEKVDSENNQDLAHQIRLQIDKINGIIQTSKEGISKNVSDFLSLLELVKGRIDSTILQ